MSALEHKFTPGPWRASFGDLFRVHAGADVICGVHKQGKFTGEKDLEEARANGRLIAAAPELLTILQRYMTAHPAFRMKPIGAPGSEKRVEQEALIALEDAARMAIKKVKGIS